MFLDGLLLCKRLKSRLLQQHLSLDEGSSIPAHCKQASRSNLVTALSATSNSSTTRHQSQPPQARVSRSGAGHCRASWYQS
eukprot:1029754-Pelagomonas_calceolata.AAC.4